MKPANGKTWVAGDKGKWFTDEPFPGCPYWLTYIRHLTTGKEIITCGCGGPYCGEAGMNANEVRKVVGLPREGGDYNAPKERVLIRGGFFGDVKAGRLPAVGRSMFLVIDAVENAVHAKLPDGLYWSQRFSPGGRTTGCGVFRTCIAVDVR
jgi:hypothetical protein